MEKNIELMRNLKKNHFSFLTGFFFTDNKKNFQFNSDFIAWSSYMVFKGLNFLVITSYPIHTRRNNLNKIIIYRLCLSLSLHFLKGLKLPEII